jgi:hypothetical protein
MTETTTERILAGTHTLADLASVGITNTADSLEAFKALWRHDSTHHDYDCALQYGEDECDCGLSDARDRWCQLMGVSAQDDAMGREFPACFAEELDELTRAIATYDRLQKTLAYYNA